LLHGLFGGKERSNISSLAKELSSNGFCTVTFDASGTVQSEGDYAKQFRMTNYLQDIHVVLKALEKMSFLDKSRIGICGHSMGGLLGIIFSAENTKIKAVCAIQSPSSMMKVNFSTPIETWKQTGVLEKGVEGKILKLPYAFLEDAQQYNALNVIERVSQPKLFITSQADNRVSIDDVTALHEKANMPKNIVVIDNLGHDYYKWPDKIKEVNTHVFKFFKKYSCVESRYSYKSTIELSPTNSDVDLGYSSLSVTSTSQPIRQLSRRVFTS